MIFIIDAAVVSPPAQRNVRYIQAGVRTLREEGMRKAAEGIATFEEIPRVTLEDTQS